jgi:hypothetical protein
MKSKSKAQPKTQQHSIIQLNKFKRLSFASLNLKRFRLPTWNTLKRESRNLAHCIYRMAITG